MIHGVGGMTALGNANLRPWAATGQSEEVSFGTVTSSPRGLECNCPLQEGRENRDVYA